MLADAVQLPHRAFQRNVRLRIGHYGNAILSRFPLADPADFDLTIRFKKRRGALVCRVHADDGAARHAVAIANIHLGLAGFERQIQLRRLLSGSPLCGVDAATPMIVAGDFNDVWENLGKRIMHPAGFELASGQARTFPAAAPLRRLDRVFCRGEIRALSAFAGHTSLARRASDHLPLIVDFELGRRPDA
jgi:endonuclease/exonuclease/phosphatase family metal-dependent hydrolase